MNDNKKNQKRPKDEVIWLGYRRGMITAEEAIKQANLCGFRDLAETINKVERGRIRKSLSGNE